MDWKPIETAPKDGTVILLWSHGQPIPGYWEKASYLDPKDPEDAEEIAATSWRMAINGVGGDYDYVIDSPPTHWAPIIGPSP